MLEDKKMFDKGAHLQRILLKDGEPFYAGIHDIMF